MSKNKWLSFHLVVKNFVRYNMKQKHILVLSNDTTNVYNFRLEVLKELINQDFLITVVSEILKHGDKLEAIGCRLLDIHVARRKTNPFQDVKLFHNYLTILRKENPDVVLTYNIKPNIYGGLACRLLKIPYLPNITGLGTALETPGWLQRIAKRLYKIGVAGAACIFFQNEENLNFFRTNKLLSKNNKTKLLPGSGVSVERFKYLPYPDDSNGIEFLFASRILKEKGIDIYLYAAEKITKKYPETTFHICGLCDDEKYLEILKKAENNGYIEYHGEQKDMIPWYRRIHCLVHPTYYPEGMSNVLLEASASGRPIITTDRAGCREIVDDGKNGFMIPIRNNEALVKAINEFMLLDLNSKKLIGEYGRMKVEKEFSRSIVVDIYLNEVRKAI